MAFWITCHMKAKREQKKAEQIVIKLFSSNYARDLLTIDNIKKTYLAELENNGLIDEFDSQIDKRKKGYYPIVDVNQYKKYKYYTNLDGNDNNLQFIKLKLSKNYNKIDENWLKFEI